jgi:broad specificity phosphatase PhoE
VDYSRAADTYVVPLTAEGVEQAARLAAFGQEQGLQFLCVSTMQRAQQTADCIGEALPTALRWDLEELQELNADDLLGMPPPNPLTTTWDANLLRLGYERLWVRLMAALARILIYAEAHRIERIAIVSHGRAINLLLLNWLGLDWRVWDKVEFALDWGAVCKVTLADDGRARVDWVNRLP